MLPTVLAMARNSSAPELAITMSPLPLLLALSADMLLDGLLSEMPAPVSSVSRVEFSEPTVWVTRLPLVRD